jgi:hypothetical protein
LLKHDNTYTLDDEDEGREWNKTQTPEFESMLNVFIPHFSAPAEKAVVSNLASKPRRNLQTFGQCLQFKHLLPPRDWCFTFCMQKSRTFATVHKSQEESCSKKVQHHLSFWNKEGNPRKTPCSANFAN